MDWTTYEFVEGKHYAIHSHPEYNREEPQYYPDLVFTRVALGGGPVRIFMDESGKQISIDSRYITKVVERPIG
jgi:hypothetical protein